METMAQYDVVVIGGGAAGLSGAVALARSRRSVVVIDGGTPRNTPASGVHNFLSREHIPPLELLALGRAELADYGGTVISGTVATAERTPDGFVVALADGRRLSARRLLVATGLVDELPAIPGLRELWGRDVIHCPYCHGWEVSDKALGILATGPLAVQKALWFRQWSADVTLFTHTWAAPSPEQAEQLAARGIAVVAGEVVALEQAAGRLAGVRLASGALVAREALVVTPFAAARAEFLTTLGLEAAPLTHGDTVLGTYIPTDHSGATAVPGVWAAGNVADIAAQVMASAAAGFKAGAMINADLVAEDTAHAVAALRAQVVAS